MHLKSCVTPRAKILQWGGDALEGLQVGDTSGQKWPLRWESCALVQKLDRSGVVMKAVLAKAPAPRG